MLFVCLFVRSRQSRQLIHTPYTCVRNHALFLDGAKGISVANWLYCSVLNDSPLALRHPFINEAHINLRDLNGVCD